MDWRQFAACARVDPEAFFPRAPRKKARAVEEEAAKALCRRCPVKRQCLEQAMDDSTGFTYGIAGGLTAAEREALRDGLGLGPVVDWLPKSKFETAALGRAAIRAGLSSREVAARFGVSVRNAERWRQQVRRESEGKAS